MRIEQPALNADQIVEPVLNPAQFSIHPNEQERAALFVDLKLRHTAVRKAEQAVDATRVRLGQMIVLAMRSGLSSHEIAAEAIHDKTHGMVVHWARKANGGKSIKKDKEQLPAELRKQMLSEMRVLYITYCEAEQAVSGVKTLFGLQVLKARHRGITTEQTAEHLGIGAPVVRRIARRAAVEQGLCLDRRGLVVARKEMSA